MIVSIVVPCGNEAAHIRPFLDSVLVQQLPPGVDLEILIADACSSDGTRKVLDEYSARHPSIRILDNPRKIVAAGLNKAIELARGGVIIRLDVHAFYADDYVAQCLSVLQESGADNVGGPAQTRAHGYVQRAISAAYHSRFACGGARFHDVNYEGCVDTVTFGCWRRELLDRIGTFDEHLVRNQDDEHNLRIVRSGGRVFQSPRIRCWYYTRSSLLQLFRQYAEYGYWKVHVIRKHRRPASVRHLVPGLFVASVIAASVISIFNPSTVRVLIALLAIYTALLFAASATICRSTKLYLLPIMPLVLATYHISYGTGFLLGVLMVAFNDVLRDLLRLPNYVYAPPDKSSVSHRIPKSN
jgi:glycosyltransferase involved in cell wall biosynthesis